MVALANMKPPPSSEAESSSNTLTAAQTCLCCRYNITKSMKGPNETPVWVKHVSCNQETCWLHLSDSDPFDDEITHHHVLKTKTLFTTKTPTH